MNEFKFNNKVPPAVELTMKQMLARISKLEEQVQGLMTRKKPGPKKKTLTLPAKAA